jgi:2-polyprenyl-3-methyl-5-hydroxy-6-metoxy-1,4-benzoquinol methylase
MSDILNYYKGYYGRAGEEGKDGYRMEKWQGVSRVAFLKQYITQVTPKGGSILDVGCGDMYLASQLPDYNWTGLDAANEYSKGRAIVHDIMSAPYPVADASQDTVMTSEVLEHVWEPRTIHLEAARCLKSGGHYLISTPNFNNLSWMLNNHKEVLFEGSMSHHFEHIRWYTYEIHKKFLLDAGFEILEHVGADAHGVDFFQKPRAVLYYFFRDTLKMPLTECQIDQIIGNMFPEHCATIMILARKP